MPPLTSSGVSAKRSSHGGPSISLAYLVSSYPTLSMAWLLREVLALRSLGVCISVAAINSPERPLDKMTSAEAAEATQTFYVKRDGLVGCAKAHLSSLVHSTSGYLLGLFLVVRLGRLDLKALAYNFIYFSEGLMVGAWMDRNHKNHLHVHLASQAATVGLYVRRVFGFGLSITVHGPDEFYDTNGQYLTQKIAAADFICCISHYARSQLMKLSPVSHWGKLVVSRLGVDSMMFSPRPFNSLPETFEVLCVGRLAPSKGQHLLVSAVERLIEQGYRVRLRLVGEGPDETSLRKRVASLERPESVVFEGAVNQDHIRLLYGTADIFCIASFAEGIPVVLMEAMAMEIPCVSTRITGIPELIRDGIDGLLVAPSDVDGLVAALAALMDEPELRERLGRSGRMRVLKQYDLNQSVQVLATFFKERIGTTSIE